MNYSVTNPILRGMQPDPSVCRVGDCFYLITSSFQYFPGIPLYRSYNLVDWEFVGHVLDRPGQLDLSGIRDGLGIFAATIRHHRGRFYVTTTLMGGRGNFLVWSDNPEKGWSDPVWLDQDWFDPSLFFDDDGKVYYTRRDGHSIAQSVLNLERMQLEAPVTVICLPMLTEDAEGPHLYKRNDWYYLVCAEGGTGYGHMSSVARSRSPWGPFEPSAYNPLLTHRHRPVHAFRYLGHGDLFDDNRGNWWFMHLGTRHQPGKGHCFHTCGRETFLSPVHWVDDWPVLVGDKGCGVEPVMSMPLPQAPKSQTESNVGLMNFTLANTRADWHHIRTPDFKNYQWITDGLILNGSTHGLGSLECPSAYCRRQQEVECAFGVELADIELVDGGEAGLLIYHDTRNYALLSVVENRGNFSIRLTRRHRELNHIEYFCDLPEKPVSTKFCLQSSWDGYRLSYSTDGIQWVSSGFISREFFATEWCTGWTGTMLGISVEGTGSHALWTRFALSNDLSRKNNFQRLFSEAPIVAASI